MRRRPLEQLDLEPRDLGPVGRRVEGTTLAEALIFLWDMALGVILFFDPGIEDRYFGWKQHFFLAGVGLALLLAGVLVRPEWYSWPLLAVGLLHVLSSLLHALRRGWP